jgi:hypothetical protein
MQRIAATVILTLGTALGVIGGGATLAGATTTAVAGPTAAHTVASTKDCYPGCTPPTTGQPTTTPTSAPSSSGHTVSTATPTTVPTVLAATNVPATGLAFTGADVVGTIIFALVLIGGGLLLVQGTRRRHRQA